MPDLDASGYIVTGVQSSNGLKRCVLAELPSRPLASLGELVNWDLRYENPCPPFAFNLVGNSDATPLLPANAVVYNSTEAQNVGQPAARRFLLRQPPVVRRLVLVLDRH